MVRLVRKVAIRFSVLELFNVPTDSFLDEEQATSYVDNNDYDILEIEGGVLAWVPECYKEYQEDT